MSSAPGRKTMDLDILQVRKFNIRYPNNSAPDADLVMTADGSGGTFFAIAKTDPTTLALIDDISGQLIDLSDNVSASEVVIQDISGIVYGLGSVISENVMVAGTRLDKVWYTTSGNSWSSVSLNMEIFTIAWNGAMWLAGGTGTNVLMFSSNGLIWRAVTSFTILTTVESVAWNGSIWIAVGINVGNPTKIIAHSVDGIIWTDPGSNLNTIIAIPNTIAWNGVAWYVGGTAVGTVVICSSTDGVNWIGSYNGGISTSKITTIISNGPLLLAGGVGSTNLVCSTNGSSWLAVTEGTTFVGYNISTLAWNGTVAVAGANNLSTGIIGYSLNGGQTWIRASYVFTGSIYSVAWNGSSWYASGINTNAVIVRSQDGITWTPITNNIPNPIYAIASRRPLPYVGEVLNKVVAAPVANTNQVVSFTIYLDYSSTTAISKIYIPSGLMRNVPAGAYTTSFPADIVVGITNLTLNNTAYAAFLGMYGQGYFSPGGWKPIQYIGSVAFPSFSVTTDTSVTINNLGLTNINGGIVTSAPTGTFTGYIVTLTLNYLTASLVV